MNNEIIDQRIDDLEREVTKQSIFIECLIELLYEQETIDKSTFSKKIEEKVELIKKLTNELQKEETEDPTDAMFYGTHGEA